MMKRNMKKSFEKSTNVLDQKRKNGQAIILYKKTTFTIIASNFVKEQLKLLKYIWRTACRKQLFWTPWPQKREKNNSIFFRCQKKSFNSIRISLDEITTRMQACKFENLKPIRISNCSKKNLTTQCTTP